MSKTPYFDIASTSLPSVLSDLLLSFDGASREKLDTLVRFCVGGECPTRIAGHANAWSSGQSLLHSSMAKLDPSAGEKRARGDETEEMGFSSNGNGTASKKQKMTAAAVEEGIEDTDPLYTLHSISITAPLRKKVDVVITAEAIRLVHPTNGSLEARIPLTSLKRAFLVSNLGKNKNKEQWAVTMISADTFDKKADAASQSQLTFNVDQIASTGKGVFMTSEGTVAIPTAAEKGEEILPLLQEFFSHLPPHVEVHTAEKGSAAFKSSTGQPYVDAYVGAKEGALCFLPRGILWANARPCEFFALEDLAPDSDTPGLGGVKTISATGRTFSVFVTRRGEPIQASGEDEESEDGLAEAGEETEFAMIDGRESENVNSWIRKYRARFGKSLAKQEAIRGKGKARAEPEDTIPADDDESDVSDEEYAAPSESDGGEPSSDSEGSNNDEEEAVAEEEEDFDEEGGDLEEEEELDPARHPLLRPGAMPKMSNAAMDAAVSIVMDDMGGAKIDELEEEEEDEGEDELE